MVCLVSSMIPVHAEGSEPVYGLGDISSLPTGTEVTLGYDATVLYKDYYVTFVKDETGYAALNIDHMGFIDGDVIQAGYTATVGGSNGFGMTELKDVSGLRLSADVNQPLAEEVTISQINHSMLGHFVVLRDVILNEMDRTLRDAAGNTVNVYQEFYFPMVEGYEYVESGPEDWYVIVVNCNTVYLTRNIFYYGLGYDYSGLRDGTEVRLRFATTVLYQHGNYLYVKDRTGYGLIYGPTERVFCTGDIIPASYYARKTIADGEVLLTNPKDMDPILPEHEVVEPEKVRIADMNHEHWAHMVAMEDVTISDLVGTDFLLTDADGNTCHGNNMFEQPLLEGHYEVLEGIVGSHETPDGQIEYRLLPILPPDTLEVRTINELRDCPSGALVRIVEPLTAIYQQGPYLYVRDCEGEETLVYGNQNESFVNGDIIVGAVARWAMENIASSIFARPYNAKLVMPVTGWTVSDHGATVEPTECDMTDVRNNLFHYIKLTGVYHSYSNVVCDSTKLHKVKLDNVFGITMPEWDNSWPYDVVGFVGYYYPDYWYIFPIEIREQTIRGDVNHDREVNIADVNTIIGFILDDESLESGQMDVNGDGEVNISDINTVLDIILFAAN